MKQYYLLIIVSLFSHRALAQDVIRCQINTSLGNIEIELYADKAPITVSNFLRYVDAGLFENSSFFRVCTPENEVGRDIKIQVIQGGNVERGKSFDAIRLETTEETGILHEDGTLSMARTAEPNSARSQFFICIGEQPELDFGGKRNPDGLGFAAFGKVTSGMDIVRKIQSGENTGQRLKMPIVILSIARL